MNRKTRIVATLGPGTSTAEKIGELMDAGMDVARLNFSHGSFEEHALRLVDIRSEAAKRDRIVAALIDLPGPKVRLAATDSVIDLKRGHRLIVTPSVGDNDVSTLNRLAVDYEHLMDDVRVGDQLSLKDGSIRLTIDEQTETEFVATILDDGDIQGRPGIHLPSERFRLAVPTEEDFAFLAQVLPLGVDAIAVSFVRNAADVERLRTAMMETLVTLGRAHEATPPLIIAKIETRAAIDNLAEVVAAADGVMVARGDLGTELPLEDVPHLQKQIIRAAVLAGKPVITATQMLESMITAPRPTRAETTDVANAVLDGTDAVMLSAETATGDHPIEAVATMARIAKRTEETFPYDAWSENLRRRVGGPEAIDHTMSAVAWTGAHEAGVTKILCCTRRGNTARFMARFRTEIPIIAVTVSDAACRQLALTWGIQAIVAPELDDARDQERLAIDIALKAGLIESGEVIAVLSHVTNAHAAGTVGSFSLVRVE